jgi:nucleotide-binding universal stress UspA family protein
MAVTDPIDKPWVDAHAAFLHWGIPALFAIGVVVVGKWLAARRTAAKAAAAPVAPPAVGAVGAHLRRVLLAVDGSETALKAVQQALALRGDLRSPAEVELHLANVQHSLPGDVTRFVSGKTIGEYHAELSDEALAPARKTLDEAGVTYQVHRRVGDPGPTIAELARETGADLIVMGTRGLGSATGAMLGSVAQATLAASPVPVLLVR